MPIVASALLAAALPLTPCHVEGTRERARCGAIEVWEDRDTRQGRRIPIKVMVVPARAAQAAPDSLFVLAGGPGQSAIEFARALLPELEFARATRNIVFVDQRGTGGSNPLRCSLGESFEDILRTVAIGVDADLPAVAKCRQELERRADLRRYTTSMAMDDLDDVRAALGHEQINLFGASYGTRAALVYIRQHPGRVRSAILRGVASVDLKLPLTVAPDTERAMNRLFGACDADPGCHEAYPLLEESLRRVLQRLKQAPVAVATVDPRTRQPHQVRVDDQMFGTTLFFLLFVTDWARDVPRIIDAAAAGDYAPLAEYLPLNVTTATGVYWGMRRSVLCAEDVSLITEDDVRRAARDTFVGETSDLGLLASCREWPVAPLSRSYFEPISTDVPVLAISGVEDPVLPPHRAERALADLPKATHLVVPGIAHGPNFPGCVSDLAAEFLANPSAEELDTSCVLAITRPPFSISK